MVNLLQIFLEGLRFNDEEYIENRVGGKMNASNRLLSRWVAEQHVTHWFCGSCAVM
jgi:hypothetical protein